MEYSFQIELYRVSVFRPLAWLYHVTIRYTRLVEAEQSCLFGKVVKYHGEIWNINSNIRNFELSFFTFLSKTDMISYLKSLEYPKGTSLLQFKRPYISYNN